MGAIKNALIRYEESGVAGLKPNERAMFEGREATMESAAERVIGMDATITSEALGPFAQYLIGRWWAKVEQAKAGAGPYRDYEVEHAWGNFWHGLCGLQSVSVACPEAVHFAVCVSNHIVQVAGMIQKELGIDPMTHPMWKN